MRKPWKKCCEHVAEHLSKKLAWVFLGICEVEGVADFAALTNAGGSVDVLLNFAGLAGVPEEPPPAEARPAIVVKDHERSKNKRVKSHRKIVQ